MYRLDLFFGIAIWGTVLSIFVLYLGRVWMLGRARSARADKDGGSILLSKHLVEFAQWMLHPLGRLLVRLGGTPDGVTWFSLLPGIGAGVAIAYGWFGLAALLSSIASFSDSLDGMLARLSGKSSESGETLDAIVDRYAESSFFIGLIVYYRFSPIMVTLSAVAFLGAFMVSYTTAKAEAQQVAPPRGLMRRNERALYLAVGSGLVPFVRVMIPNSSQFLQETTMIIAIVLIAIIANLSSFVRVGGIRRALRQVASESLEVVDISAPVVLLDASVNGGMVTSEHAT
ncbi:MAG: CDP-alcohol phosphatidyltransferase family protein [Gemmatimonadaceae bacterium]